MCRSRCRSSCCSAAGSFCARCTTFVLWTRASTASGVLIANTDASRARLDADRLRALSRDMVDRLAALPGVKAASVSMLTPIWGGGGFGDDCRGRGKPAAARRRGIGRSRQPRLFRDDRHVHSHRPRSSTGRMRPMVPWSPSSIRNSLASYSGTDSAIGQRFALRGDTLQIVGVVG